MPFQESETLMTATFPNYINGRTIDSADRTADINPSNVNDIVGEFARGTTGELDQAIAAARDAFKKWSRTTPQERFDILDRAGTEILARKEELGRLLSRTGEAARRWNRRGWACRIHLQVLRRRNAAAGR